MTAAGAPAARGGISIGAVLDRLRGDFPDVTISKIRFLESEGLVMPARLPSGYRQFSSADVDRLRYILSAQRDHYLPLKVIKEQLDAIDSGIAPAVDTDAPRPLRLAGGTTVTAEEFAPSRPHRLSREELLGQADVDEPFLAELLEHGLLKPGAVGFFDSNAVVLVRTAKAMAEFGVQPRHLRAFRAAADREAGLVSSIAGPVARQRDPQAQARARELVTQLAALSVTLHTAMVKAAVSESFSA